MRNLKLIWDFRGPDALKIAEHHSIHLKEYSVTEELELQITGYDVLSDIHAIAYIVVIESEMPKVRDALKPHRGELYNN